MSEFLWEQLSSGDWLKLFGGIDTHITILDDDFVVVNQMNVDDSSPLYATKGQSFTELLPGTLESKVRVALEHTARTGETVVLELPNDYAEDGVGIPIQWYRHEIRLFHFEQDQTCIVVYSTNISVGKALEAEFSLGESLFQAIFDQSNDAFVISRFDPDDFNRTRIVTANQKLLDLAGYSLAELKSMDEDEDLTFTLVEEADHARQNRERILAGESLPIYERTLIAKDGHRIPMEVNMVILRDDDGRPQYEIAIARDIGERTMLEEKLQRTELRFRAIFENASDGITIARRRKQDYFDHRELIEANDMVSKIMGYSREEMFHMSWTDVLPQEEVSKVKKRLDNPQDQKLVERRILRKDGTEGWIESMIVKIPDVEHEVDEIIVLFRDITERKQVERELLAATQRFKSLADNLPAIVILVDQDENYLYVNKSVAERVGMPQEMFVGRKITDVVKDPVSVRQWREHIAKVFEARTAVTTEFTFVYTDDDAYGHKKGEIGHNLITVIPQFDEHGNIFGTLSHSVELGDIYQRELELREAKLRAENAIKGRDRFLANVSHELRTPLNVILGFARLLYETGEMSGRSSDYLDSIIKNGQYLARLVHDLLDATLIDMEQFTLNIKPVDLHELIQHIAKIQASRATAKNLGFVTSIYPNVPQWIMADEIRLRQIILNLIDNAIKYTDSGKVELQLAYNSDLQVLNLDVMDTGSGISEEFLDSIFEAFVVDREKNASFSIGLGLYISRSLAKLMGGDISVESEVDGGSVFHVSLPVTLAVPEEHRLVSLAETPMRLVKGDREYRVTIIDDIAANAELLSELLEMWGFEVVVLYDTSMAIERIREWHPQVILLDLYMPELDGFKLAELIRNDDQLNDLTIIAVTASAAPTDHQKASSMGCDAIITKPINFEILAKTLSSHLGVRFEYVVKSDQHSHAIRNDRHQELSSFDLRKLPDSWLQRMSIAAASALTDEALALVGEIKEEYPVIAARLYELINTFQMGKIVNLLGDTQSI